MQDQIKIGLVGCGGISAHYVRLLTSFADRARVVAVCDLVEERAAERPVCGDVPDQSRRLGGGCRGGG